MPVADVWVVDVERAAADGLLDGYRDVLSADELAQLAGFSFDADRRAYLATHGLARTALSARAPSVATGAWRFRSTGHGRPEVDAPAHPGLRFNLSHTRRTVACVVTEVADCGVDVELVDGATDVDLLARGVLTAAERAAVDTADPAERRAAFFRHWTLKEAYAKARGVGMSLPFDRYGFTTDGTPALVETPDDDAAGWEFAQWRHGASAVVAVAVRPACEVVRHNTPPATITP